MAKENIIETLAERLTLPVVGEGFTAEEASKFLSVLAERLTELQAELGIAEVKASSKGVSVSGKGKVEYPQVGGDWRDAVLDCVSRVAKMGGICGGLRVDVSEVALRWAVRRREKAIRQAVKPEPAKEAAKAS